MMKSVTKEKVFHVLKLVLLSVTVTLVLLSLLGTVAHASGLVDDTVNADNLYSKYPLSNYQLDFYVDNSWSWLQGFPDGWTALSDASDSARYRALGNSVAIPCVEFIMRGITIAVSY